MPEGNIRKNRMNKNGRMPLLLCLITLLINGTIFEDIKDESEKATNHLINFSTGRDEMTLTE